MTAALLEVRGLRKSFAGVVANDSVDIDVPRGGIVGLVGPNGSGKTTLFNAISGQHPADSGSVRFEDLEISRLPAQRIARLGILRTFQQAHVYDRMSCLDNLRASAPETSSPLRNLLGVPAPQVARRARDLLAFVGLETHAEAQARRLSFGQRKLLEFAMALMSRPRLLLLDEPTAGVDPAFVARMIDRLTQANSVMGITLLIIEHDIGVLGELAARVYVMHRGAIVAKVAPEAVHAELERAGATDD